MRVTFDAAKLAEALKPHDRSDAPGFAIGVAHRGVPLFRRGYGLANCEAPLLLTPASRIRIGSTSKHFTVLAVLLLAEEGRLASDDSIRRHLPDMPDWAEPITIHHLVTHTSGMRDSLDVMDLTSGVMGRSDAVPHAVQRALLRRLTSTNFAPGTDWNYCNGGYVLLTELIERLSGMDYAAFVKERIFDVVGLHDTAARPFDTDFLPGSATLHVAQPDGSHRRGIFGPEVGGEGNLVSTVDDMLRWLGAMRERRIGTARTWEEMFRSGRVRGSETGYAGGLVTGTWRGLRTLFHTGMVFGGNSQMLTLPDHALDVVVLANTSGVSAAETAWKAVEACIEGLEPAPKSAATRVLRPGCYRSPDTGRFIALVDAGDSVALSFDPVTMPLRIEEDGRAWLPANLMAGAWIAQAGDALEWHEFGGIDRLEPLAAAADQSSAAIAGRYRCTEMDAEAAVDADGKLTITTDHGKARFGLVRKTSDIWALVSERDGWTGTLEHRGGTVLLSTLRTRRLPFRSTAQPSELPA
ncbi:serine hydrolase domain-containing protein [Erythrobacter sp. NE805]|uniref:serine hydrolase domain-containing protein n=1 Tax=Erythrobacter sp. NE805 TaxID=3389875 RepID=UPI00396B0A1F